MCAVAVVVVVVVVYTRHPQKRFKPGANRSKGKKPFEKKSTTESLSFLNPSAPFRRSVIRIIYFTMSSLTRSTSAKTTINVEPKPSDILAGRGKATYTHPGNKRYLQLINESIDQYIHESTKVGKTAIVRCIVQKLQKEQRRFLQRDAKNDSWYELSRRGILDKVGHSLRDMKQTRVSSGKKTDKKTVAIEGSMDPLTAARAGLGFTSRLEAAARMPYGRSPLLGLGGMMAYPHPQQEALLRQRAAALGPYVGASKLDAILETTSLILKERAAMNRAMQVGGGMGMGGGLGMGGVLQQHHHHNAQQQQQQQQHHAAMMNMSALNIGMFGAPGMIRGMRSPNFGQALLQEAANIEEQQHHAAAAVALQQARANQQNNNFL